MKGHHSPKVHSSDLIVLTVCGDGLWGFSPSNPVSRIQFSPTLQAKHQNSLDYKIRVKGRQDTVAKRVYFLFLSVNTIFLFLQRSLCHWWQWNTSTNYHKWLACGKICRWNTSAGAGIPVHWQAWRRWQMFSLSSLSWFLTKLCSNLLAFSKWMIQLI